VFFDNHQSTTGISISLMLLAQAKGGVAKAENRVGGQATPRQISRAMILTKFVEARRWYATPLLQLKSVSK